MVMTWTSLHCGSLSSLTSTVWACFCFLPFGPCLGGFLLGSFYLLEVLWHLMSQWPTLQHDQHVESSPRQEVLPGAWEHSAILTCMLFLGVWYLLLPLVWARLRSLALFIDSINSSGLKAHSIEVVCDGYVSPACFEHPGCCGLEVKGEQFLDKLTVCEGTD